MTEKSLAQSRLFPRKNKNLQFLGSTMDPDNLQIWNSEVLRSDRDFSKWKH